MYRINNNDFKILVKYKEFMNDIDNILENVPRKDMYYKDRLRSVLDNLLEYIFRSSYEVNKEKIENNLVIIKSNIAMIDYMLDRLHNKKYILDKSLYKIGNSLIEINKMVTGWINNKI